MEKIDNDILSKMSALYLIDDKYINQLPPNDTCLKEYQYIFHRFKSEYETNNTLIGLNKLIFQSHYRLEETYAMSDTEFKDKVDTAVDKIWAVVENKENLDHWKNEAERNIVYRLVTDYYFNKSDAVVKARQDCDYKKLLELANEVGIEYIRDKKEDTLPDTYSMEDWLKIDHEELINKSSLINGGFFCRRETIALISSYGSGKSTLVNQLACAWANGQECLGWNPNNKQLKTLILQCEDFGVKNTMMFQSILKRYKSTNGNIRFVAKKYSNYKQMLIELRKEMTAFQPDILIINPLYKYLQGGESLTKDNSVGELLAKIEELTYEYNCGCLIVHHLKKDGSSGYGSALLDWSFRGIIYLDKIESGIYQFRVDKRESESDGIHNKVIKWSKEVDDLFWLAPEKDAWEKMDLLDNRILQCFHNGNELTVSEIETKVNENKSTILLRIKKLLKYQKIIQTSIGKGNVPSKYKLFKNAGEYANDSRIKLYDKDTIFN